VSAGSGCVLKPWPGGVAGLRYGIGGVARSSAASCEARAAQQTDPAAARKLWAQVDRVITGQAPWVPIFNRSGTWFVSARVRNCQESPYYAGPLLDQIWIR
jgi:hypothetical protein